MKKDKMTISKIKNGTVIDHIPAGRALQLLHVLGISHATKKIMSIATHQVSRSMKRKDIVKIEGVELDEKTVNKIAVLAPDATINIIKNYEVVKKNKVSVPDELISVIHCLNENCICTHENIHAKFRVEGKNPLKVRCCYCERVLEGERILDAV